jgi:hypothetical protein
MSSDDRLGQIDDLIIDTLLEEMRVNPTPALIEVARKYLAHKGFKGIALETREEQEEGFDMTVLKDLPRETLESLRLVQ